MIMIIQSVLLGLARGLSEGMIMTYPGVRDHVAFYMYHVLSLSVLIVLASLLFTIYKRRPKLYYVFGLFFIIWECFEIGYNISRYSLPFVWQERIVLGEVSFVITGYGTVIIHICRIILVYILTFKMR